MTGCCYYCSANQALLQSCNHCHNWFCSKHRSPADHKCPSLRANTGLDLDEESSERAARTAPVGTEPEGTPPGGTDDADSGEASGLRSAARSIPWTVLVFVVAVVLVSAAGVGLLGHDPGSGSDAPTENPEQAAPLVETSSDVQPDSTVNASDLNRTSVEHWVHQYINQQRRANGLPPLEYDSQLAAIAEYHSTNMDRHNFTGHIPPNGETLHDRLRKFNASCTLSGELTLYTYYDRPIQTENGTERYDSARDLARGIVQSWMRSDAHRRMILNSSWEREGIGVVTAESNKVYVTQNLCGMG